MQKKNYHVFLLKLLSFDILDKLIIASVATDFNHYVKKIFNIRNNHLAG